MLMNLIPPKSTLNALAGQLFSLTIGLFFLAGCAHAPAGEQSSNQPGASKVNPAVPPVKAKAEAPTASAEQSGEWKTLFDGKSLAGWKATDFAGAAPVNVENGQIVIRAGAVLNGINWTNTPPKTNYEVTLEAMKVEGSDFFFGFTFPVGESHCSFIAGGWGGGVVGISSINGADASENETTKFMNFEKGRWYRIRVRVTQPKIEAWIDDEKMVDLPLDGNRISMRSGEIELSEPFGVATFQTTAALRNIKLRLLGK
jgi:hypothetical protein